MAGFACADALLESGGGCHRRWMSRAGSRAADRAQILRTLGAEVRLGEGRDTTQTDIDLLVVSPGFPPNAPIIVAASSRRGSGVGRVGVGLAPARSRECAHWLVITGTNGKTTTTLMLESMLRAAGVRALCGWQHRSISGGRDDAHPAGCRGRGDRCPAIAVLAQRQPHSAVCLNVAEDHVDHFGSFEAYARQSEGL